MKESEERDRHYQREVLTTIQQELTENLTQSKESLGLRNSNKT